ncbi:MAG: CDP-diacylglycerol--serine O-phosphatidyltransferase [Dysgonamonadaceae bacterium]|jgi:CDP-diacylglycerol--serine O-phosphatidyltransferase|nr:CDP-diacylglycerol--serine O-phosphatidyltransferase [Dysgonamonadaceae bacterium]
MRNIPNLITCLNLLAGSMACVMALHQNNYTGTFVFIALAAVFDFLDGFAARLLKAYSKIGAELDSLADIVSFGLAPGCIVYIYLEQFPVDLPYALPFIAFLLPVFSALRLAKFNIDTRQTTSFLGLPVPANALFWASLIPSIQPFTDLHPIFFLSLLPVLLVTFCLLLVSELPMFSLKFKNFRWKGNEWPYSLLFISLLSIVFFHWLGHLLLGISLIIIVFILMSLVKNKK